MLTIKLTNTSAGLIAIQRALAGEDITFTKLDIGDGVLTNLDISNFTSVINKITDYPLGVVKPEGQEMVRLRANINNVGITEDKAIREFGLYAKFGSSEQEFLFAYMNTGDIPTALPSSSGGRYDLNRDFVLYIGSSTNVTFDTNGDLVYSTLNDYKALETQKEDKFPKNSGFNLDKTDLAENDSNKVFTPKGALNLFNTLTTNFTNGINAAKEVLRLDIVKKLNKGAYSGDAQDLKNDIDGHVRSVVSDTQNGHMSKEDKIKLDNIDDNANNYSLPVASGRTLGGVKIGNNLSVSGDGTISGLGRYIHPIETGFYHIPVGGESNKFIKWESDGIGTWDFIDWDFIQNNPINPNWRYCCSLRHPDTATSGYTITTNIPFDAYGMYHVRIEGYAYGSAMPIMIDLVFYIYPPDSTTFVNCRYHYYGYDPGQIILFHNNNNIRIFIQNNIYYISLNVYATVGTLGDKNYLNGWSMVENGEQPSGVSVAVLKRKIYTEDDKPTIQEIGALSSASALLPGIDNTITYGIAGLQFAQFSGLGGDGTSGQITKNPYDDWFHHIILNHNNSNGYYTDFAFAFHQDDYRIRRVVAGTDYGWQKLYTTANKPMKQGRTLLWSGTIGTGNFTLNENYRNYDYLIFVTAPDNNDQLSYHIAYYEELEHCRTTGLPFNISNGSWFWAVMIPDDGQSFISRQENSILRYVFGGII